MPVLYVRVAMTKQPEAYTSSCGATDRPPSAGNAFAGLGGSRLGGGGGYKGGGGGGGAFGTMGRTRVPMSGGGGSAEMAAMFQASGQQQHQQQQASFESILEMQEQSNKVSEAGREGEG